MANAESDERLSVYVNDHLAGAVGALRLCARIERWSVDAEITQRIAELRAAIAEDRRTLAELRSALGLGASPMRDQAAKLLHTLSRAKLRITRSRRGAVGLLHALDMLALGIEGKKALWDALAVAAEADPRLRTPDYPALLGRADAQLALLRPLRARAARKAFTP
jgi:hypothetical protein